MRGINAAEKAAAAEQPPSRESPAALVNGQPLSWDDLRPLLAEAAGGQVVQEAVLDRLLVAEVKSKGLSITESDVAAERRLLVESIARDAKAAPADGERLLESVRRSRGLGDQRFQRLLERNARMRKLVAPTVEITESEVALAFEMLHGPKYRVRVITTSGEGAASAIRSELAATKDQLGARFADAALRGSTDSSAGRGGAIDPFSSADPAYPAVVREAVKAMAPGQISPVLAVDRGFAIVLLEEVILADNATLAQESSAITAQVRTRRERQAMDALGLRLVRGADLKVMDRSLDWSLKAARTGPQP